MTKYIAALLFLTHSIVAFSQDNKVDNPIQNFDYLWNTFNDRYANFEIKKIDWDFVYQKYRPLVTKSTTNKALFDICNKMLLTLKDGHSNLIQHNTNGSVTHTSEDGSFPLFLKTFPFNRKDPIGFHALLKTTQKTLINHQFTHFVTSKKDVITYATNPTIGYLGIQYMFNLPIHEFRKTITQAITAFKNKNGLILDLRFNPGGHNKVSNAIACLFTDQKRIGYYTQKRIPKTKKFTTPKPFYLKPKGENQFTKPIIVLTSDFTASAAETLVLSLKQLPHVIILGSNTNGVFSQMYDFKLPNNWEASLSYQQQLSPQFKNYEGIGIPPDIKILNTSKDITNQEDTVIVKAIEILSKL